MAHDDARRTSDHRRERDRSRSDSTSEPGFVGCDALLDFHCELYDVVGDWRHEVQKVDPDAVHLTDGRALPARALLRQCRDRPREDWRSLIRRYLDRMVDLVGVPASTGSLSTIDLRVRLVAASPLDQPLLKSLGGHLVAHDVGALLSIAESGGCRTITPGELASFEIDADRAWTGAWQQTEMLVEPDEVDVVDLGGVDVVHLFGSSECTATLALSLEQHLGPLGDDGAIVGIPCDHTVLAHPIDGPVARRAIGTLVPIVRQVFADGPGSLSAQLFWWHLGRLVWIPTSFGGPANEVYLPAGLGASLD